MNCDNDRLVKSCKVNVMIDNLESDYEGPTSQKIQMIMIWTNEGNKKIIENSISTILNFPTKFRNPKPKIVKIDSKYPNLIHCNRGFFIILILCFKNNL